jgi:RNA polymerase sigma factor (sigma-70 family)
VSDTDAAAPAGDFLAGRSVTGEDVLSRALAGETAAFGLLVRHHQGTVFSLALRMLSDRHKAEDLAQEVFLQLHRSLASVTSTAHLVFWLRKVTVNRAIDRLRREPKIDAVPLEEADGLAGESLDQDPLLARRLRTLVGPACSGAARRTTFAVPGRYGSNPNRQGFEHVDQHGEKPFETLPGTAAQADGHNRRDRKMLIHERRAGKITASGAAPRRPG